MRPDERTATPLSDLFRLKLVNLIDLRHELCRLAQKLPWQALVDEFGALYAEAGTDPINGRPELSQACARAVR